MVESEPLREFANLVAFDRPIRRSRRCRISASLVCLPIRQTRIQGSVRAGHEAGYAESTIYRGGYAGSNEVEHLELRAAMVMCGADRSMVYKWHSIARRIFSRTAPSYVQLDALTGCAEWFPILPRGGHSSRAGCTAMVGGGRCFERQQLVYAKTRTAILIPWRGSASIPFCRRHPSLYAQRARVYRARKIRLHCI